MKCEMWSIKVDGGYYWRIESALMQVKAKRPVKARKTALRQARRVAKRLGMEVGK